MCIFNIIYNICFKRYTAHAFVKSIFSNAKFFMITCYKVNESNRPNETLSALNQIYHEHINVSSVQPNSNYTK